MNLSKKLILSIPLCLQFLTGCIQEEPLNAEADILQCVLTDDKPYLITKSDTLKEVTSIMNNITIFVTSDCDLTKRAPKFVLTEGATISPASGSVQDFSDNKSVTYTVTSESGEWKRSYNVSYYTYMELPTHFDFEHYQLNETNKYHVIYEVVNGIDVLSWWNSGNPGYTLASNAAPEGYPTVCDENGYEGRGMRLTTCYAGSFGKAAGMPIAAGNLFLGTFNVQQALKAPLEATRFGVTFTKVPKQVKGFYKYKPGEQMRDVTYKEISGTDDFNIYAIFYENTDENGEAVMLNGADALSSKYLVLKAEIDENTPATDQWTEFSIDFKSVNGKTVDYDRLANFGYNFSVVFTASRKGDAFTGAVGSELWIDEVDVVCEEAKE